jgi:hypothetical protein
MRIMNIMSADTVECQKFCKASVSAAFPPPTPSSSIERDGYNNDGNIIQIQ